MMFKFLGRKPPFFNKENKDEFGMSQCIECNSTAYDYCNCEMEHYRCALKEAADVIHGWTHESIIDVKTDGGMKRVRTAPNQSHLERLEEMLLVSAGENEASE